MFKLDKKLEADSHFICDLKFCCLLLMNNANYPWLILVPKKANLVELTDLDFSEQIELLQEVNLVADILQKKFSPHKLNIAMLGNMVRQLHIHVIARFENDKTFPNPVWGGPAQAYDNQKAQNLIAEIKNFLQQKDTLLKQILYRSIHRGCKETDFLIGEFAKVKIYDFDWQKLQLFKELIEEDDLLIYDWILNKREIAKQYGNLIEEIRVFHKI